MQQRIDWEKSHLIYVTREDQPSLRQLSTEYNIPLSQITTKARVEGWKKDRNQFRLKVVSKVEKKLECDIATRITKNLKIIEAAKGAYLHALRGKKEVLCPQCQFKFLTDVPKAYVKLTDLSDLVRLESFLMGEEESRHGIIEKIESGRIEDWTIEQQKAALVELLHIMSEYEVNT